MRQEILTLQSIFLHGLFTRLRSLTLDVLNLDVQNLTRQRDTYCLIASAFPLKFELGKILGR